MNHQGLSEFYSQYAELIINKTFYNMFSIHLLLIQFKQFFNLYYIQQIKINKQMMEHGILAKLLETIHKNPGDVAVEKKCLFAISCLLRNYQPAQKVFFQQNGFSYLMKFVQKVCHQFFDLFINNIYLWFLFNNYK